MININKTETGYLAICCARVQITHYMYSYPLSNMYLFVCYVYTIKPLLNVVLELEPRIQSRTTYAMFISKLGVGLVGPYPLIFQAYHSYTYYILGLGLGLPVPFYRYTTLIKMW